MTVYANRNYCSDRIKSGFDTLGDTVLGSVSELQTMAKRNSSQVLQQSSEFARKRRCTKSDQKSAAWTSSPLNEEEAAQSEERCFQRNKVKWHTLHFGYLSTACTTKVCGVCSFFA